MSSAQVAAEQLATLAMQHGRRGTPVDDELAAIFERMADRLQGGAWHPPAPAAPPPLARDTVEHRREVRTEHRAELRAVGQCHRMEDRILTAIQHAQGGISAQELAAMAEIDPRKARAIISHLRADHAQPICSTPADGYTWPRRAEDTHHTLASLESRRIEIEAAIAGIRAGANETFGTAMLPGMEG